MEYYLLSDDIKYRRENFGCVTLNIGDRCTRFYNKTASLIIESCQTGKDEGTIAKEIGYAEDIHQFSLGAFLYELVEAHVLTVTTSPRVSQAKLYFTDVTAFPDNYLFMPLGVEIELTLKCYRNCSYCSYNSNSMVDTKNELTTVEWYQILQNLSDNGVLSIRFTGGDPFVREDFLDLLRYADKKDFVLTVGSDLTILTSEHVEALAGLKNLYILQTTLDGASPETADLMRGRGNFARVTRGLQLLNEKGVPFMVGTVLHKKNLAELRKIGELVGNYGAAGYCFAPLYPAGRGRKFEHLIPSNEELGQASQEFREMVNNGVVRPADPAWSIVTDGLSTSKFDQLLNDQPYLIRQADRLLRIDPLGRCYTSIKLKEYLDESVYLGKITDTPLRALWHNAPLLQALRNLETQPSAFGRVVDLRRVGDSITKEMVQHGNK